MPIAYVKSDLVWNTTNTTSLTMAYTISPGDCVLLQISAYGDINNQDTWEVFDTGGNPWQLVTATGIVSTSGQLIFGCIATSAATAIFMSFGLPGYAITAMAATYSGVSKFGNYGVKVAIAGLGTTLYGQQSSANNWLVGLFAGRGGIGETSVSGATKRIGNYGVVTGTNSSATISDTTGILNPQISISWAATSVQSTAIYVELVDPASPPPSSSIWFKNSNGSQTAATAYMPIEIGDCVILATTGSAVYTWTPTDNGGNTYVQIVGMSNTTPAMSVYLFAAIATAPANLITYGISAGTGNNQALSYGGVQSIGNRGGNTPPVTSNTGGVNGVLQSPANVMVGVLAPRHLNQLSAVLTGNLRGVTNGATMTNVVGDNTGASTVSFSASWVSSLAWLAGYLELVARGGPVLTEIDPEVGAQGSVVNVTITGSNL